MKRKNAGRSRPGYVEMTIGCLALSIRDWNRNNRSLCLYIRAFFTYRGRDPSPFIMEGNNAKIAISKGN